MICTGVSKDNNQFDLEIKVTLNTGGRPLKLREGQSRLLINRGNLLELAAMSAVQIGQAVDFAQVE